MQTIIDRQFTIRCGTTADSVLLLAWREAMMRDMGNTNDERIATAIAAFSPWLAARIGQSERFVALIGECDGTPVACAMVMIHDHFPGLRDIVAQRGYIFNVYTHPRWRRRGYAGQLVQACVNWLRERGIHSVSLHASQQGQSVYARLGFHAPGMPEMVCGIE